MENIVKIYIKKLTLIILLLIPFLVSSQEDNRTIQIYETTNGIQNLFPSQTIIETPQSTTIYNNNDYGIPNLTPSTEIINNEVYNVNEYGIRDLTPIFVIEIDDDE